MQEKRQREIKQSIKKTYGNIALDDTEGSPCCGPDCCSGDSAVKMAEVIGYRATDLKSVPQASILGVGCGAPVNFADLKRGETVLDLGSGAGIDVFLAANIVGKAGKVIGVDMTDEMLARAKRNAGDSGYENVEFVKGDIEKKIPAEDNSIDAVISNCVINLTLDKVRSFKEVRRILKPGGRMVISDLVADRNVDKKVDLEKWSACIDGALTKQDYIDSIKKAGFGQVQLLSEQPYMDGERAGGRSISSIVVRAVK